MDWFKAPSQSLSDVVVDGHCDALDPIAGRQTSDICFCGFFGGGGVSAVFSNVF